MKTNTFNSLSQLTSAVSTLEDDTYYTADQPTASFNVKGGVIGNTSIINLVTFINNIITVNSFTINNFVFGGGVFNNTC